MILRTNCISKRILNQILKGGSQYSYKIARETKSSYSPTHKNIKGLEKMGLIEEVEQTKRKDSRRILLKITPEGIEVALRLNKIERLCK